MKFLDWMKQRRTPAGKTAAEAAAPVHQPASGSEPQPKTKERRDKIALLTPREHELFLLLLEGFTLKEAAARLSVKYSTANTHMTSVYRKLNVNSRAELIINYRETGGEG